MTQQTTKATKQPCSLDAYIEEAKKLVHGCARQKNIDELAQRYHGDVYAVVSGGKDIHDAYTLLDKVKVWVSDVTQTTGTVVGLRWDDHARRARDTIEARILSERIKHYKEGFDATLEQAQEIASYCRERLDEYGAIEADNKVKSIEFIGKAQAIDELVRESAHELECLAEGALHADTAQERGQLGIDLARKKRTYAAANVSKEDFVRHAGLHNRTAKIAKVLYVSMSAKYQCVAQQAALILEKGKHIDQVLHDYSAGANINNIALLRQRTLECGLIQSQLRDLDSQYTDVERALHVTDSTPDADLEAAYVHSLDVERQMSKSHQEGFHRAYSATMRVALD